MSLIVIVQVASMADKRGDGGICYTFGAKVRSWDRARTALFNGLSAGEFHQVLVGKCTASDIHSSVRSTNNKT